MINNMKKQVLNAIKFEAQYRARNIVTDFDNYSKAMKFVCNKFCLSVSATTYINNTDKGYVMLTKWVKEFIDSSSINRRMRKYRDNSNEAFYILTEGTYKAIVNKCLIIVTSELDDNVGVYQLTIDIIGKNRMDIYNNFRLYVLEKETEEAKKKSLNINKSVTPAYVGFNVFNNSNIQFKKYPNDNGFNQIRGRSMDTLFSDQKQEVVNIINDWGKQKMIYHAHGLNFKTGILLHGVPGTGKTSLVKALATKFGMNLVSANLASMSIDDLTKLDNIVRSSGNTIFLLEEIDLGVKDISEYETNDELMKKRNELLTLLDGANEIDNVIFIATTNNIKVIPDNIKRSGRFDHLIEITDICKETAIKMCESFNTDPEVVLNLPEFKGKVLINPSKLQEVILSKFNDLFISAASKEKDVLDECACACDDEDYDDEE